jgi:hypothetical protein
MSVCLNPNIKSVSNFKEQFGEKNLRVVAEAVNNNMPAMLSVNGNIEVSKTFLDIEKHPGVLNKVEALDIYMKLYSDEFKQKFKGEFNNLGEPVIFKDGKYLVNLFNNNNIEDNIRKKHFDNLSKENKRLFESIIPILEEMGLVVDSFENYAEDYKRRTGIDFDGVAMADMAKKLILLKDNATFEDFTEEVAHYIIEALGPDHAAVKAVMRDIESTELYKQIYPEYSNYAEYQNEDGTVRVDKIKKEAAGQLLNKAIIERNKQLQESLPKRLLNTLKRLLNRALAKIAPGMLKQVNNSISSSLGDVAADMIVGNFSDLMQVVSDEVYYSKPLDEISAKVNEIIANKEAIKGLTEDGRTVDLSSGEQYKYYINPKTGKKYERVTSYISEDEYTPNDLLTSSQVIGTKIDNLVRDFFSGIIGVDVTEDMIDKYGVNDATELSRFLQNLSNLKKSMEKNGEKFLANDIILFNDEIGVAGTVDLLTYDSEGNFRIYDMKTMRGNNFEKVIKPVKEDGTAGTPVSMYDFKGYFNEEKRQYIEDFTKDSKREKHQKQLSLYRILLANTHAVDNVSQLSIIPIAIEYNAKDTSTSTATLLPNVEITPLDNVNKATLKVKQKKAKSRKVKAAKPLSSKINNKAQVRAAIILKKLKNRLRLLKRMEGKEATIKRTEEAIEGIKRAIANKTYEIGILRFMKNLKKDLEGTMNYIETYKKGGIPLDAQRIKDLSTFIEYYDDVVTSVYSMARNGDIFVSEEYLGTVTRIDPITEKPVTKSTRELLIEEIRTASDYFDDAKTFYNEEAKKLLFKQTMESGTAFEGEEVDWEALATYSDDDISGVSYYFGSMANVSDPVLRKVFQIITHANYNVNRFSLSVGRELIGLKNGNRLTNEELQSLYETDGKGGRTGYLINEYNLQKYEEARKKFSDDTHKKHGLTNADGTIMDSEQKLEHFAKNPKVEKAFNLEWYNWMKENTDTLENAKEIVKQRKAELSESEFKKWRAINIKEVKVGKKLITVPRGELVVPSRKKFANSKFDKIKSNKALMEFRDKLITIKREALLKQPSEYFTSEALYRMPQISKTFMQRVKAKKSFFKELPELLKDEVLTRVDDDYAGQLFTRNDGTTTKVIPLRYNRMLENREDLSIDLISLYTEYASMAENFKERARLAPKLDNVMDVMRSRTYKKGRATEQGAASNAYKALESFLGSELYGESTPEQTMNLFGREISLTKLSKLFQKWVRAKNLIGNFFSMLTGAVVGGTFGFIERIVGQYASPESGAWAQGEFLKNFGTHIAEISNPTKTSKQDLMFQEHMVFDSAKEIFKNEAESRIKKMVGDNLFYGLYSASDYKMKGIMTLAVFDNYRLNMEDGVIYSKAEFITKFYRNDKKGGNEAWKKMKDKSYYNLFETKIKRDKNGKVLSSSIEVKPEYKKYVKKSDINQMTGRVRQINSKIDGVITEEERSAAHRGVWSNHLMTHRGWLPSGLYARFKHKGFNPATGTMEEGYYRTVAKGLRKYISAVYNPAMLKAMMAEWKTLDNYQKMNVRRAVAELATIIAYYVAALILNKIAEDDEEDDWYLEFLAYMSTRTLLETSVLTPPFIASELTATLQNPIAGMRHIEDMFNILDLLDPNEVRSGPYKGHSKAFKFFIKMLPGVRGWYEVRDPKSKNSFLKMKALKMYPGL